MKAAGFSRRWTLIGLLFAALAVLFYAGAFDRAPEGKTARHVYDEAGLLKDEDRRKLEEYLTWVQRESDVDLRFVFLKDAANQPLEQLAARRLTELGVGGQSGNARGALLLYDPKSRQLRIEVGYGLEGILPDAFVAYLMGDHAQTYLADGADRILGLRLLVRLLHHRIREAVLGRAFDPRVLDTMGRTGWLSGGAGASSLMPRDGKAYAGGTLEESDRRRFGPQSTPEAAYRKYLEWLALGRKDARIGLLTSSSRAFVAGLPLSKAYFEYILFQETGRAYNLDERGKYALLTFTDDPLVSPHFLVKDDAGWRLDLTAEVRNTRNRVGGIYAWDIRRGDDAYLKAFEDRLEKIRGYWRIKGGDNRELPLSGLALHVP